MPKSISLLIPCYNAARYLPRLAECIRAQTMPFAEILCYDDASTDDTIQVARGLGFKTIAGEINCGPAFARNILSQNATAPWVHFHDADDLLSPHYVEKITPLLDDTTDVVVCQMDWVKETTRELVIAWRFDPVALASNPVKANLHNPIGVIACTFRRSLLLAIGGFDQNYRTWEDGDLQVRLANKGARYRVHPEVLATGLRHEQGASSIRDGDLTLENRTQLLENYVHQLDARFHPEIAFEAEHHAAWLLAENHRLDLASRDLAICRAVGWQVPSTNNPLLRAARKILPSRWLLVQRERYRRRVQKNAHSHDET